MQFRATRGRSTSRARHVPALLTLTLLIVGAPLASPALASAVGDFVSAINSARAQNGLAALSVSADLTTAAQNQANAMAAAGRISHIANLGAKLCCWSAIGQNSGSGPDVATVHAALMNSPAHRGNILDAEFTQVGVGVASANGLVYVSEVFRSPKAGARPAPPPPPAASPTAKPPSSPTPKASPTKPPPPTVAAPPPAAASTADAPALPPALVTLRNTLLALSAQPSELPDLDPVSRGLVFAALIGAAGD